MEDLLRELNARYDELLENKIKLDEKYDEINLFNHLLQSFISTNDPKQVLEICIRELEHKFGYERCFVMLISRNQTELNTSVVNDFGAGKSQIQNLSLRYPSEGDPKLFLANVLESGKTLSVCEGSAYLNDMPRYIHEFLEKLQVKSLIAAAIEDTEAKYGLLVVGAVNKDRLLNQDDTFRIENIARVLSAVFKNARAYEELEKRSKKKPSS